jgi:hypothetical protein
MKLFVFCLAAGLLAAGSAYAQVAPQSDVLQCMTLPPIFVPEGGPPGSEFKPAWCGPFAVPDLAVLMFEPGTATLSDQIWTQAGFFYFASDPDFVNLAALNIPVVGTIQETGAPQDVSGFWGLNPGTVLVQSDVGNETDAPEPATVLFAAPALLVLGIRRLRTR